MKTIKELETAELESILNGFYESFETGYDFEFFLKPFLESIGLSEVVVTKRSGDGGVDLTAVKDGLTELNGNDVVRYKVQAKRYNPSKTMSPEKIDALRGTLLTNEKGLFITTARVSDKAKSEALTKDGHRPVIVLDGMDLVSILIDKGIGFVYKPMFSLSALSEFISGKTTNTAGQSNATEGKDYVYKKITNNDIRVRIISIPSSIIELLKDNDKKHPVKVIVNKDKEYDMTYTPSRKYLAGFKTFLDDYNIRNKDGTFVEKTIGWYTDGETIELSID